MALRSAASSGRADRLDLAWLRFDLARALRESGVDRGEALRLAEAARSRVAAAGGHPARLAAAIEARLSAPSGAAPGSLAPSPRAG